MNDHLKVIVENQKDFLKFLKARFHLYHLSNVFFRDLHYGVMGYLSVNKLKLEYSGAEVLTYQVIDVFEKANTLRNVGRGAWVLTYPEFKKPLVKPVAPAKPAVPSAKPGVPATAAGKPTPSTPVAVAKPVATVQPAPQPSRDQQEG